MEIILSVLLIVALILNVKVHDWKATSHSNTYEVYWGKVNDDRRKNNLSDTQVNKNIASGKYDTGKKW